MPLPGLRPWRLTTSSPPPHHRRHAPFLVPFGDRARVFQSVVSADRQEHREISYRQRGFGPQSFLVIRRTQLLQDGFDQMHSLGDGLKVDKSLGCMVQDISLGVEGYCADGPHLLAS